MKKNLALNCIAAATLILSAAACRKAETPVSGEQTRIEPQDGDIADVFAAGFKEDIGTKTYITTESGGAYAPKWNSSDKIYVNGVVSNEAGSGRSDDFSTCRFTFGSEVAAIDGKYYAVAPSMSAWDENGRKFTILVTGTGSPQQYKQYEDKSSDQAGTHLTYHAGAGFMASCSDTKDLEFKSLMAFYKLTFTQGAGSDGANIKSIYIRKNNTSSPNIAGAWQVRFDDSGNPSLEPSSQTKPLAYNCGDTGVALGTPVLVAVPAYDYTDGLIVTVKDVNGHFQSYSISGTDAALASKQGVILNKTLSFNPQSGTILSAEDWEAFAAAVNSSDDWDLYRWVGNGTVKVGADITAENLTSISKFGYIIDGQNHTITRTTAGAPLITTLTGTVKNLTLAGSLTSAGQRIAAFAQTLETGGLLKDCTNTMSITVNAATYNNTGGLVSIMNGGEIDGCTNDGAISVSVNCATADVSTLVVGGIVGQVNGDATLTGCKNKQPLTAQPASAASGHDYGVMYAGIGGIAGWLRGSSHRFELTDCDNEGAVTYSGDKILSADGTKAYCVSAGGIVGIAGDIAINYGIYGTEVGKDGLDVTFKDCDNSGQVRNCGVNYSGSTSSNTKNYTGGIAGSLVGSSTAYAKITSCTSTGTLLTYDLTGSGTSTRPLFCQVVGGLVGYGAYVNISGSTVNCTIGNGKRMSTAMAGAIGFAMRDFSVSNSTIWFTGNWARHSNYNLNSASIAVVPMLYGSNSMDPAPSIAASSVTDCKMGGIIYYCDVTDANDTSDQSGNLTKNFTLSASTHVVRGKGFTANTGVKLSGNTYLTEAPAR